jgi:hypothetical protein
LRVLPIPLARLRVELKDRGFEGQFTKHLIIVKLKTLLGGN